MTQQGESLTTTKGVPMGNTRYRSRAGQAREIWSLVNLACLLLAPTCLITCSSDKQPPVDDPPPTFKSPLAKTGRTPAPAGPAGLPATFITLPSGLQYAVERAGVGDPPKPGQRVAVNYAGFLTNGKRFDASKRGRPFTFVVGANEVIPGWEEAIRLMKTGTRAWFKIPPDLAYGDIGSPPDIPPGATLIFYMELAKIYEE